MTARWHRICPPSAWLMANSSPQMEHPCTLGLGADSTAASPSARRGFLWLAQWPPSAWKDGNYRL
ncbi:hypothetical protein E2562_039546 [Oryza meyeriana var. granulata]|uniref:Uncharacterized protein n=1 Tax=Oryza meyeriana var. granulata TaxID=110450 RepID=A0A6G1F2B5_9ORYZ|nr:hypothetical protein E2562_039546 [Oryza meyeriana var. granulata]